MTDLPLHPNRPRRESRNACHSLEPPKRMERVGGFSTGLRIASHGVPVHLRGQIIATVAAVIITNFPNQTLSCRIPFQLVDEAQALLAPLFEVPFIIGRLLGQGIRPVLDDAQAPVRGEVNCSTGHGNARHPLIGQPATARKIIKSSAHLANGAAGSADPKIIGKPCSQTESVFERKPLLTANRGHGHPSQHSQSTIGSHHQRRPMAQRIASGLGREGTPVPAQIRRPSVSVFAPKTATAVGTDPPRSHDVN